MGREKLAIAGGVLLAALAISDIITAMNVLPPLRSGMEVAANGGDITPYILTIIGVLLAVALPTTLLGLAD